MMRSLLRSTTRQLLARRPVHPYTPRPNHIWLIRPDHLGDLLFLRPALKRFREQMPGWQITLAVGPWSRSVVADDPNVDELVEIPFPGFTRACSVNPAEPYRLLFETASLLRQARPSAAVILRDDHWWGALLARQAGVPVIVGSELPEMRGLLTHAVPNIASHSVEKNARLLAFAANLLGGSASVSACDYAHLPLCWNVSEADRAAADQVLTKAGVDRPFVVIHPGSGAPVKLWPAERWASVASAVARRGYSVVLTGGESERPDCNQIRSLAEATVQSFAGQTSLPLLAAIFEQATAVSGVDSGPLDLAVAVGTPTVQIYGPSDVTLYGPWGDRAHHQVLRAGMSCPSCGNLALTRPAGAGCMIAVPADEVISALSRALSR